LMATVMNASAEDRAGNGRKSRLKQDSGNSVSNDSCFEESGEHGSSSQFDCLKAQLEGSILDRLSLQGSCEKLPKMGAFYVENSTLPNGPQSMLLNSGKLMLKEYSATTQNTLRTNLEIKSMPEMIKKIDPRINKSMQNLAHRPEIIIKAKVKHQRRGRFNVTILKSTEIAGYDNFPPNNEGEPTEKRRQSLLKIQGQKNTSYTT